LAKLEALPEKEKEQDSKDKDSDKEKEKPKEKEREKDKEDKKDEKVLTRSLPPPPTTSSVKPVSPKKGPPLGSLPEESRYHPHPSSLTHTKILALSNPKISTPQTKKGTIGRPTLSGNTTLFSLHTHSLPE
jgi:hypothetical protein